MYVFTDESGHFVESNKSQLGIIVVVSVTDKTLTKFKEYAQDLLGDSLTTIKASTLHFQTREKLLKFIGKNEEIRYSAFVYDYAATTDKAISKHKANQLKKLEEAIEKLRPIAKYPSLVKELDLLRNQVNKLSLTDYMKTILVVEAYRQWTKTFTFDYVYTDLTRDSWSVYHIFDMQNKPVRFVKMVYSLLYLTTNTVAGAKYKVYLPKEWSEKHPFLQKHDSKEGVDLKKFYSHRRCGNDEVDLGLKLPDLISNTLLRSVQRNDKKRWLKILKRIQPNISITHRRGRAGRRDYYTVVTFPDEGSSGPSKLVREHWNLMRNI